MSSVRNAAAVVMLVLLSALQMVLAQESVSDSSEWVILSAPDVQQAPVVLAPNVEAAPSVSALQILLLSLALVGLGLAPELGSRWAILTAGRNRRSQSIPAPSASVAATATVTRQEGDRSNAQGGRQLSSETVSMMGRSDMEKRVAALRAATLPAAGKSRLLIAQAHLEHGQLRTATAIIEALEREVKREG